jgi:hypothetical protein
MSHPVPIAPVLFDHLTPERWNQLSDAERLEAADLLTERMEEFGWSFARIPTLRRFGPPPEEQVVLRWQEERTGLTFSLIPGGVFAPGYDVADLARYARLHQRLYAWGEDQPWTDQRWEQEEDEEEQVERFRDPPEETQIFASECTCDLRQKPAEQIGPFLMATVPVPANTPGMREAFQPPQWQTWEELLASSEPLRMRWPQVQPILDRYSWELPTSAEYEWALRGGKGGLFYWGNNPPAFLLEHCAVPEATPEELQQAEISPGVRFDDVMILHTEPNRARRWPYTNRFGLVGMLAWGHWCTPDATADRAYPLIVRGGAAQSYPWQGCGEWKSLLNAAEKRLGHASNYGDWNTLRPIARFVRGG